MSLSTILRTTDDFDREDPHQLRPLIRGLLSFTSAERVLDATSGSGITARVCDDVVIPCDGVDLNDPLTPMDLFDVDIEEHYDLVIFHPDLWRSRPDATHPHDFGAMMSWDGYVDLVRDSIMHLARTLKPGGRLAIIAPLARKNGKVYDLGHDLKSLIGRPAQPPIIHPHPHVRAQGNLYGKRFIPIAHDEVLLWTREEIRSG